LELRIDGQPANIELPRIGEDGVCHATIIDHFARCQRSASLRRAMSEQVGIARVG
jgi:hypothetical protein